MSNYQPRITRSADGDFYALIVRIDRDGQEQVIHGYKGRYFSTLKAAQKSVDGYISKMRLSNPIDTVRRNIMGTASFNGKFAGMRKAQDFIIYPLKSGDNNDSILIQSDTRIGRVNMKNGVVSLSKAHASGAYQPHLSEAVPVGTLTGEELLQLKSGIMATASGRAGSSGMMFTDNSGAIDIMNNPKRQANPSPRAQAMKATFVKSGNDYLPAIKDTYSGNVKVLYGDRLATAATAKKYAQIEINRLNNVRQANPAPRIGTARPRRVSQVTKKPPTKRLVARRKRNTDEGYFPNPIDAKNTEFPYVIMQSHKGKEENICACRTRTVAEVLHSLLTKHAAPGVVFYIRG